MQTICAKGKHKAGEKEATRSFFPLYKQKANLCLPLHRRFRQQQEKATHLTLHLFNPSHEEALAADYPYYYPTIAARKMAAEWGTLPALWAGRGQAVWLPEGAEKPQEARWCEGVRFVTTRELTPAFWKEVEHIQPWGWDLLVRHRLRRAGAPEHLLPTDAEIASIRHLSSRATTSRLLARLRAALPETVGESIVCRSRAELAEAIARWRGAVVKSLWSCSGRGIFRMTEQPTDNDLNRAERLTAKHGGVEAEPWYDCAADFALEFSALPGGEVRYEGLSLFAANPGGDYRGNAIGSQEKLEEALFGTFDFSRHAWQEHTETCRREAEQLLGGAYAGPFGIDMMIVRTPPHGGSAPALRCHPCVEINLRRTMGHAALCAAQRKLKIEDLPNFLQKTWYICQ